MIIHLKQSEPITIHDDEDCTVVYKDNRVSVRKVCGSTIFTLYTFPLAELIYIDFQNI